MSDNDEVYPLDQREEKSVHEEALKAGAAARLAWAKENAPIKLSDAPGREWPVALWLLTSSGRLNGRDASFEDLYEHVVQIKSHDSHAVGYFQGKQFVDLAPSFNWSLVQKLEVEGAGAMAVLIAKALCSQSSLDEAHEISNADWGVRLPGGQMFEVRKSRIKRGALVFKKRTLADDILIECMGKIENGVYDDDLDAAFYKGHPICEPDEGGKVERGRGEYPGYNETEARLKGKILKNTARSDRLRKKGARKESLHKAMERTRTVAGWLGNLRSKK